MPPTPLAMEDEEEDRTVALEPEFMEPVTVEPTGVIRLQAGEGGAIYDCSLAEPVVIGRDENACKIVISGNKSISRKHCRIYQQDGNCYVEDLNSFNHTYVNHEMVSEPTQIRAGDSLSLGALEFVVAEIDLEASV